MEERWKNYEGMRNDMEELWENNGRTTEESCRNDMEELWSNHVEERWKNYGKTTGDS